MTAAELAQKRIEAAEQYRAQLEADWKAVLALPAGRRLVWNITQERAGVLRASFGPTDRDSAYREGRRSIGLEMLAEVKRLAPAEFREMVEEGMAAITEEPR